MIILLYTELGLGSKLGSISLHSFLTHSLFLIVWYPGRNGDPWSHLGEARLVDRTGAFYAYDWLMSQRLVSDIVKYKSQYALVVFFRRMFTLDIYWVHAFFIPLLWSLFVPIFLYKIAEMLSSKKSKAFPLLAAVSASLFPPLVYWGTISVPNSLAFLFLLLSIVFILYGVNSGGMRFWLLAVLASIATTFSHPQTGIFAVVFILGAVIIKSRLHRILKGALLVPLPAIYPYLSARFMGAEFSLVGLLDLENVFSFQAAIISLLFVFAFLGLVFSLKGKLVVGRNTLMLFVFFVITAIDYYVAMYGMQNSVVPDRMLPLMALLLAPFAALGIWVAMSFLKAGFSRTSPNFKIKTVSSRNVAIFLICVFVSLQFTAALLQTYPIHEISEQQPAGYAVEAIQYVDSTAPGRYLVLTDPGIASLAGGILGIDHTYGGEGVRGTWGVPEWTWWTVKLYSAMGYNPSISLLEQAMLTARVGVVYIVVWGRHEDGYFDGIVQRISRVLTPDRIFGDGLLYVYNYTSSFNPISGDGPSIKVTFDSGVSTETQTQFNYFLKSEVTYNATLSGYSSYNVTDFPTNWTFDRLMVNGAAARFDSSSDINTFVYIRGLNPSDTLEVFWKTNEHYPRAAWKEDSFKYGWQTHPTYTGLNISPNIGSDGNTLSLSGDFSAHYEEYQYYYYTKNASVATNDYPYILVRWKTTGPVAVVAVAYSDSPADQYEIVPYSSDSTDWMQTVVKLAPDRQTAYITVGITNLAQRDVSGLQYLFVDYILICAPE
jgi:hypothetical protein